MRQILKGSSELFRYKFYDDRMSHLVCLVVVFTPSLSDTMRMDLRQ